MKKVAKEDMIGRKFGRLTVTGPRYWLPSGGYRWACSCDCGKARHVALQSNLRLGRTKSCGCSRRKSEASNA